jgi:tetrahydromethanopterin S-methyltransferase subunit E
MKSFKSFFNPSYGYLRALVGIVAGLVLLIWPDTMKDVIVRIIGGLFLVIGCVSLVIYLISRRKAEKSQGTTDKVKDNSFEFQPCGRTPQVDNLSLSLGHQLSVAGSELS